MYCGIFSSTRVHCCFSQPSSSATELQQCTIRWCREMDMKGRVTDMRPSSPPRCQIGRSGRYVVIYIPERTPCLCEHLPARRLPVKYDRIAFSVAEGGSRRGHGNGRLTYVAGGYIVYAPLSGHATGGMGSGEGGGEGGGKVEGMGSRGKRAVRASVRLREPPLPPAKLWLGLPRPNNFGQTAD